MLEHIGARISARHRRRHDAIPGDGLGCASSIGDRTSVLQAPVATREMKVMVLSACLKRPSVAH